jgi:hypothetical protein
MFTRLLLRDAGITAAVLSLWWFAWPVTAASGPLSDVLGLLLGFGAGVLAYLGHEWGHLLGAFATGAHVRPPAKLGSAFLFSFDSRRNSQTQFVVMSLSGFAVTGVALWVAYGLLPDGDFAVRILRGMVVFSASLTLLLEVPLLTISLVRGSILAQAEVFPASDPAQKNM